MPLPGEDFVSQSLWRLLFRVLWCLLRPLPLSLYLLLHCLPSRAPSTRACSLNVHVCSVHMCVCACTDPWASVGSSRLHTSASVRRPQAGRWLGRCWSQAVLCPFACDSGYDRGESSWRRSRPRVLLRRLRLSPETTSHGAHLPRVQPGR